MSDKTSVSETFKKQFVSQINNRLSRHIRKFKQLFNIRTKYQYAHFSIALPANHLLPMYQLNHKNYDRFLPHLCKYIETQATVIDVGANCGATLASMYDANRTLTYLCIEPDDTFFEFLQNNISRIHSYDKNASIYTVKSLVGKDITGVHLEGTGGSKHAVINNNKEGLCSERLDKIFAKTSIGNVRLLKSDVDGFDYDVINSAESILSTQHPILFFECQFDFVFQKSGYEDVIASLARKGYQDWVVFDNFGDVVLRTNNVSDIYQLIDYVWRQNIKQSSRTIFYYDLLASTNEDRSLIGRAVDDYLASY